MGRSHDIARGASTMYQTQAASDTRYANVAGDTFTGTVSVNTSTSANLTVNSGIYGGIQFQNTGTNTGYITSYTDGAGNESMYMGGADKVNIHTGTNHALTGGTTRLQIDGSGNVTMPYQPCFAARGYSTTTTQIASMNPLLWSNVHTNIGNCFNNSTGKFTFPVSGRYYYECNVNLKAADGNWMGLYFVYNGTAQHNSWSRNSTNSDYNDTIVSGITDATANDYMAFCWHNSYVSPVQNNTSYNYASVHLIG